MIPKITASVALTAMSLMPIYLFTNMIHNIPKITRPKLEQGFKPTTWSPCSIWSSSLIKQTADKVIIEVEQQQGNLVSRVGTLEVTASAITQNVQTLSSTTSSITQQVGNLTVTSSEISASVKTVEEKIASENLFPLNGWIDNLNNYIEVTGADLRYSGSTGSSAITSPQVYLEAGTYTLSSWNQPNKGFVSGQNSTGGTAIATTNKTTTTGLENSFKNMQRTWCNITISQAGTYTFKIGQTDFYKPKLELGSTPTPYSNQYVDHHSLIEQTDDSISLKVVTEVENQGLVQTSQLVSTGIDIENQKITLTSDNVQFKNNSGQTTMTLDSDGNLNTNNATIKGQISTNRISTGNISVTGNSNTYTQAQLQSLGIYDKYIDNSLLRYIKPEDRNNLHCIDLDTNKSTSYYTPNDDYVYILPHPKDYPGVQLNFYNFFGTRSAYPTKIGGRLWKGREAHRLADDFTVLQIISLDKYPDAEDPEDHQYWWCVINGDVQSWDTYDYGN